MYISRHKDVSHDTFDINGIERDDLERLTEALETHIASKQCYNKKAHAKLLADLSEAQEKH